MAMLAFEIFATYALRFWGALVLLHAGSFGEVVKSRGTVRLLQVTIQSIQSHS